MNMNNRIPSLIAGSGGLAREIAFYLTHDSNATRNYDFLGYLSDSIESVGVSIGSKTIVMTDTDLVSIDRTHAIFIGTGSPIVNNRIFKKLKACDSLVFPNFISSNSLGDWERIFIGKGNVITYGCAFTTDIQIGDFSLFNLNSTVGHDSIIGNFNVFNPSCNISGSTKIGSRVLVGTGAQVLQGLSICDDVVIGAGAVVTKDITEPGVYVGMPARRIK